MYGYQIPYKSDKLIKTDRSLTVQVRTAGGVEANNQTLKTSSVRSNGILTSNICAVVGPIFYVLNLKQSHVGHLKAVYIQLIIWR